jgi:mannitol-1-phosphate/altronate dehydrogenase
VVCEDYRQWVLEDDFVAGRPGWETLPGVLFVEDVFPYELMKLRLLNTSHSALAYPAYMAGHRTVDGAMSDRLVAEFVAAYMEEVTPSCLPVPGVDLEAYKKTLIERFGNPGVKDQVQRLAEDGSTKIGNQMVPIILENVAAGRDTGYLATALASYISYMTGIDGQGEAIEIKDPFLEKLQPLAVLSLGEGTGAPFIEAAFGAELAATETFMKALDERLVMARGKGIPAVVEAQLARR